MKKIILLVSTLTVVMQADISVNDIQSMISEIHKKRPGFDLKTLEATKEPFIRLKDDGNSSSLVDPLDEENAKLELHSILNGKAFINDAWLKVGDKILGYNLKYIGKRGVVLRGGDHIKKLFLHKNKDNIIHIQGRK